MKSRRKADGFLHKAEDFNAADFELHRIHKIHDGGKLFNSTKLALRHRSQHIHGRKRLEVHLIIVDMDGYE